MALEIDSSGLLNGLMAIGVEIAQRIRSGTMQVAGQMETYAKQNAPWTDCTGNARRTMEGFAEWGEENCILVGVAGHMPYSPDLEVMYGRRYAILVPTLDHFAPTILDAVVRAVIAQGGLALE